jgi:hypothetical protein
MRLWKRVDGEPYMINPRLGILALQALNPKRRKNMAKHYGARHMAWVRSFRKKNKHHKHHRKHNPYPLAGTVAAIGNYHHKKHHRKHNPGGLAQIARGTLGLPPLMPVVYGAGGFVATAATQGFIDTLAPAGYQASQSMLGKYVEIALGIVIVTWAAKHFFGGGASAFVAVGGGIFALQQAVHDFIPGMIPGMHSYTPLKSYTPVRRAQASTMGAYVESAGGEMPQLATRDSMPQLAAFRGMRAPDQGWKNSAGFAADGGMNIVAERFRRL